jgi:signal transduction histidine kinase/ligand-binding sensor domain-containing protein
MSQVRSIHYLLIWLMVSILFMTNARVAYGQADKTKPAVQLLSDAPLLRFKNLGVQDGLAQSSANNIMQDSHGFVWIATQGGLHRYDGYEFKLYSSVAFDTTSLSDDWIWTVTESKMGGLWVTTEIGGLNYLDRSTDTFRHYRFDPDRANSLSSNTLYHVLESSGGDLWVSTLNAGLNRMKAGSDDEFIHYFHDADDPNSLTSDVLFWLSEDSDGQIWASSANGINKIDPESGNVTRYLYDAQVTPVYGAAQNVLGQYAPPDQPDIMWLATGKGLVRLNKETGDYDRFVIEPEKNGSPNSANLIHGVVPDPEIADVLWVAGPGTGLARFDIKTGEFSRYRNVPTDANSLPDDFSQSLYVDRSGTMWVGHTTEGISTFNPGAVKFSHYRNNKDTDQSLAPGLVWAIYEDKNGSLWAGTEMVVGGSTVTHFNAETRRVARYRHNPTDPSSLLPGILWGFAENESGVLFVAGDAGLSRFNATSGRFTHYLQDKTEENWGRNNIITIQPTANDANMLWVGSLGGLDVFDTETAAFTRIPIALAGEEYDPDVMSLFEDENNKLWLGSSIGLVRYDPDEGATLVSSYDPLDPSTISGNEIESIHVRSREPGVLWLAPFNRGLNRYDINSGAVKHFTTAHGLPSNTVYGILEDSFGTLWLSTNAGISNFDPETETFRNYGLDEGLIELEFNQGAFAKGKNGIMYFGSAGGVTSFVPEQLHINQIPPQVIITGIKLFNKPVPVGSDTPLPKPLSEISEITLNHDQNEVTFEFVALHFANSAKNTYAYILGGYDHDWVQAGTQRSATYTNLAPGTYEFRVKAANADGVWNDEGASITLTVLYPWYRSLWAYGFYLMVFVGGVISVDRFQRKRLLQKEREEAREKELAQAKEIEQAYINLEAAHENLKSAQSQLIQQEKLASLGQLTAGIAHEIKNPLNFVNNFSSVSLEMIDEALEELDKTSQDDHTAETAAILADIKTNLIKIHEHGSRADGIVKSMLQHSRGGTGKMEPTDLNALVSEFTNLAYHGMRAGKDPIDAEVTLDLDETIGDVPLVYEDFSRVILNICTNAFDALRGSGIGDQGSATTPKASNFFKDGAVIPEGPSPQVTDGAVIPNAVRDLPQVTGGTAHLKVRTRREGDRIAIEIEDNGPGIPDEIKDKILQPFFTTKKGTQGTGLGLSITHDIVKAHGGELSIHSKLGIGCTFIISLPSV